MLYWIMSRQAQWAGLATAALQGPIGTQERPTIRVGDVDAILTIQTPVRPLGMRRERWLNPGGFGKCRFAYGNPPYWGLRREVLLQQPSHVRYKRYLTRATTSI
jgi:hypothetical protein